MALLRALSDVERETGEGLGVMQLAAITGRDKSQVSRALHALEKVGVVERDAITLRYRLGYGLYVLATRGIDRTLISVASPFLADAASELHEGKPCRRNTAPPVGCCLATQPVTSPKDRRENELEVLAEAVVRTANDVSLALGWQPAE